VALTPEKVTKFVTNDLNLTQNKTTRKPTRVESVIEEGKKVKAIYKTVVIPKEIEALEDVSMQQHIALAVTHL
jgi:hypothetical protein